VEQQLAEEKIPVKDEPEVTEEQPFISCMTVKMEHPLDESLMMKEEESQQLKEEESQQLKEEESQQLKEETCIEDDQPLVGQESASDGYKVRRPERVDEQMDGRMIKPCSR
jgi:hypothetical protein